MKSSVQKSSGMEAMRRKQKALQDKADGKGRGGDGEGKYDKLAEGKNYRRVLPIKGTDQFFVESMMHYRIGPSAKTVVCIGGKCPICKKFNSEVAALNKKFPRGDERGKRQYKKLAEAFRAKQRYLFRSFDPKADEPRLVVTTAGEQILRPMLELFFDEEECGNFTDRRHGRAIIITREGTERDTKYSVRPSAKVTRVPIGLWKEFRKQLTDADGLIAEAGEVLDVEQIKGIMDGAEDDEEDVNEDEEDTDSEDEEDEGPPEDEEEEEEDEEDDEEDEDDEDERPAKKSSTKDKLKKKARR